MSETRPRVLSPEEAPWEPLDVDCRAEVRTVIGPDGSQTLGAGFARLVECEFEWRLDYDEVLYVLDGAMEVEYGDTLIRAEPGQVMFVPKGSDVIYRGVGTCTCFYATYPVDWESGSSNG